MKLVNDETACMVRAAHDNTESTMKLQALFVASALSLATTAFAQNTTETTPQTPRIDKREARQDQRVYQGVASGELTQKEAARLEKGDTRIANAEAKAKSDGQVTRKERARLTVMQKEQSQRIYRQKHDKQVRSAV
jgi:predicted lipoprotein with Yx(FWY)xxD motif